MSNLPNEVLNQIFTLLLQQDKLECMTVCRQWHDVIYHRSLFSTIYITDHSQLWRLMGKVEKNPLLGTKVEHLILQLTLDRRYNTYIFIKRFPNLRRFSMLRHNSFIYDNNTQPQRSHPWCDHIESVVELGFIVITMPLLYSGICNKLTYLSVEGREMELVDLLVKALKNAPALKKLYLKRYTLSIDELETLHENVPLLDSLSLQDVQFYSPFFPNNIRPATLVKRFECIPSYIVDSSSCNPNMNYISQKYTHLEELVLGLLDPYYISINNTPTLLTHQKNIVGSYLKALGLRLKTLSLDVANFYDSHSSGGFTFSLLDQCGCQIKNLKLARRITFTDLEELAKTTQVQYIQSLNLMCISNPDGKYDSISTEWLTLFTVLKELHLHTVDYSWHRCHRTLNLTYLLENLSGTRLETLIIKHVHLQFNNSNIVEVYPSLKELSFFCVKFETGIDSFISRVFPNIKRLKLNKCLEVGNSFMLPDACLSYLEIRNWTSEGSFPIMVNTLGNNQTRLYNSTVKDVCADFDPDNVREDLLTLSPVYSQPFNTSMAVPKLKIVCKSVFSFFMVNYNESGRQSGPLFF